MKIKKIIKMMTLALALTVIVPVYTENVKTVRAESTIKINKKKVTIVDGKTLKLKITGTKKKVTWKSSKKSVATVSKTGKVTAKKAGTAKITATVNKKKYICKVTVEIDADKKLTEFGEWLEAVRTNIDLYMGYLSETGKEIFRNEELAVKNLDVLMKKAEGYDKFIRGLKGSKYSKLKRWWGKYPTGHVILIGYYSEYLKGMYQSIKEGAEPNYGWDSFNKYGYHQSKQSMNELFGIEE